MNLFSIFEVLEKSSDDENARHMSQYMRDQFPFLGIKSSLRKEMTKDYFKEAKKEKRIDWDFVDYCWEKPYREAQYVAVDYLKHMNPLLVFKDIERLKNLIITKSWWDTVDGLHRTIGDLVLKDSQGDEIMVQWSLEENLWLRRIALNHQMFRKEKMKKELLEEIIVNNLGSHEFFINKALGWALRDYSKTNPSWVRGFIHKYEKELSKLSIKEASKYI